MAQITQETLNDMIATVNAGKQYDMQTWHQKFPEFGGDDKLMQSAMDYVATYNSGKYKSIEEVNAKFPEFFSAGEQPAQKKENAPFSLFTLGTFKQHNPWTEMQEQITHGGLSEEERKYLPSNYTLLTVEERKKAEQKARADLQAYESSPFIEREKQLQEQPAFALFAQRSESFRRIRSAQAKNPDDLFSITLNSWQHTDEGIRRTAQYERDMQSAVSAFQKKKQKEFGASKEAKAIIQKAKAGTITKEQAEQQLQKLWEDKYGEELQNEVGGLMEAYQQDFYAANKPVIEEEINRLSRAELDRSIAETESKFAALDKKWSNEVMDELGVGKGGVGGAFAAMAYSKIPAKTANSSPQVQAAKTLTKKAKELRDAVVQGKGLKGGFVNGITDISTWDFGISDLNVAIGANVIVNKIEKGEELNEYEQVEMDALLEYMSAQAMYSGLLGRWYKAGNVTAQAIPFMLEFLLMPIDGIKNATVKAAFKYGLKKFGIKQGTSKAIDLGVRTAGRFAGSAASAALMTATFDAPRVLAGTTERMTGTVKAPDLLTDGLEYAGRTGQQGGGEAFWNAAVDSYVNNLSEMMLSDLAPAVKLAGMSKIFKGLGNKKAFEILRRLTLDNKVVGTLRKMQTGDFIEEFAEEEVGNLLKWVLSTDVSLEEGNTGFDADSQIDTVLGLIPMQAAFGAAKGTAVAIDHFKGKKLWSDYRSHLSEQGQGMLEAFMNAKTNQEITAALQSLLGQLKTEDAMPAEMKEDLVKSVLGKYQEVYESLEDEEPQTEEPENPQETQEAIEVQPEEEQQTRVPAETIHENKRAVTVIRNGAPEQVFISGRVVYNEDGSIDHDASGTIYIFDANGDIITGQPMVDVRDALDDGLRQQKVEQQNAAAAAEEIRNDDTEGAPVAETEEQAEQPSYPTLEDGSPDYANMTTEQEIAYAQETGGEQKVRALITGKIEDLQEERERVKKDKKLTRLQKMDATEQIDAEIAQLQSVITPEQQTPQEESAAPESDIRPVNVGDFGPIYNQFEGKPQEAIAFLMERKDGECLGALSHPEIGPIDLVWGVEGTGASDGYGLSKLVAFHPEVLDNLQGILDEMHVTQRTDNRVQLESEKYQAGVRLTWNNESKTWLLTAFEKQNSALDKTTDTGETADGGEGSDTALPQNTVSGDKGTTNNSNTQISEEENAEKVDLSAEDVVLMHYLKGSRYKFCRKTADGKLIPLDGGQIQVARNGKETQWAEANKEIVIYNGERYYMLGSNPNIETVNLVPVEVSVPVMTNMQADHSSVIQANKADLTDENGKRVFRNAEDNRDENYKSLRKNAKTLDDILDYVVYWRNIDGRRVEFSLRDILRIFSTTDDDMNRVYIGDRKYLGELDKFLHDVGLSTEDKADVERDLKQSVSEAAVVWSAMADEEDKINNTLSLPKMLRAFVTMVNNNCRVKGGVRVTDYFAGRVDQKTEQDNQEPATPVEPQTETPSEIPSEEEQNSQKRKATPEDIEALSGLMRERREAEEMEDWDEIDALNREIAELREQVEFDISTNQRVNEAAGRRTIGYLKAAGVKISEITAKAAEALIGKEKSEALRDSDGVVYGFTQNGQIYVISGRINPNTPVHEYTHLWARVFAQGNPKQWANIVNTLKQTTVWGEVESDANYESIRGNEQAMASEVLARLTGEYWGQIDENGRSKMDDTFEKKSTLARIRASLRTFWKQVAEWLGLPINARQSDFEAQLQMFVRRPILDLMETNFDKKFKKMQETLDKGGVNVLSLQQISELTDELEDDLGQGNRPLVFERIPHEAMQSGIGQQRTLAESLAITALRSRRASRAIERDGQEVTSDERISRDGSNTQMELDLMEYAKEKGLWFDNPIDQLNERYGRDNVIGEGQESVVWTDEENGKVIKAKKTAMYESLEEFLEGVVLNNWLFADNQQTIIGYGYDADGNFRVIYETPYVKTEETTPLTQQEKDEYMKQFGFEPEANSEEHTNYTNGLYEVRDLHNQNIIRDGNGVVRAIDPVVKWPAGEHYRMPTEAEAQRDEWNESRLDAMFDGESEFQIFNAQRQPAHAEPMSWLQRKVNAAADQANGIRVMQQEIERITGRKITYEKDVREALEHSSSIIDQALKRFEKGPQRRLDKAMKNIRKQLRKNGLWRKGMSDSYTNESGLAVILTPTEQDILERYLMAKDNLERIEFEGNPRMEELAARLRQQMNLDEEASDEDVLLTYVNYFESKYSEKEIKSLWRAINECTDFSLDWLLKGGLMGQDLYDKLKQRRHYVPERDFAQLKTNDEIREEVDNRKRGQRNGQKPIALQKAEGGRSMASDVIANILLTAANSVQVSQENIVKRAMFDMMQENLDACQQMGYPVPEKVWYVRDGVDEDGNPRYKAQMEKPSDEIVRQNEEVVERIRGLQEDLKLFGKGDEALSAHIKQLIAETRKELLIVRKNDAGQASVDVAMLAGEEVPKVVVTIPSEDGGVEQYVMQFPARAEIANALNGVTGTKWEDKLQKTIGSNISALYTVYNPTFFATNLPRDIEWIVAKGSAERGMLYPAFFAAEMVRPATTILPILEYVSGMDVDGRSGGGKLADAFTTDGTIEREFYQFLNGGGNTGYTQMNNIQKFRKKVDRMTEGPRPVKATMRFLFAEVAPAINEFSELWTRFAVYRATKAMLKSENATIRRNKPMSDEQIEAEALHDAKNFSTNFNRKGAGGFINFFNSLSMFSNAAIQGVSGAIRTFENPKKAIRGAVSIMILPAFVGWMCTMLSPDDDDEEYKIPDYMRDNNLIFMDKRIPLSQELIPWYRIGVNYALMQQGRRSKEEAIESIGMGFAEHGLPVPPVVGSAISTGIDWAIDDDDYSSKEQRLVGAMTQLMYAQYLGNLHQLEQNKSWTGSNLRNEFAQGRPQYLFGQNEAELFKDWSKLNYRLGGGDMNVPQNTKRGSLTPMNEFADINPKELRAYLSTVVPSGWLDIACYAYGITVGDEEPRKKDIPVVNKFQLSPDQEVFEYSVAKEMKAMAKAYDEKRKSLLGIWEGYSAEEQANAARRVNRLMEETAQMGNAERRKYVEEEISENGNDALLEMYLTFGVNLAEDGWDDEHNKVWKKLSDAYTKLSIFSKGVKQGKSEAEFVRDIEKETGVNLGENATIQEARMILTALMLSEQMRVKGIDHTMPEIQKWMLDQPWLPATKRARKAAKKK